MKQIAFIDLEVSVDTKRILDYGAVKTSGETIHMPASAAFLNFLKGSDYLCGHNIIQHDMQFLQANFQGSELFYAFEHLPIIDTLPLSPLLFPQRPYHALLKDDKLQSDELNNPLNDAKKAQDLFYDEVAAYQALSSPLKAIFEALLAETKSFQGFFHYLVPAPVATNNVLSIQPMTADDGLSRLFHNSQTFPAKNAAVADRVLPYVPIAMDLHAEQNARLDKPSSDMNDPHAPTVHAEQNARLDKPSSDMNDPHAPVVHAQPNTSRDKPVGALYNPPADDLSLEHHIREEFFGRICSHASLTSMCKEYPVALAYCLSLIRADDTYSITPPWVLHTYPEVNTIMQQLRGKPCLTGCDYCNEKLDAHAGLGRFFGYTAFRDFDGVPLQEKAVKAAIANQSLLAVFPTGGGKSITFQLPALMAGHATKGLTVVISPLQSLMKDQVDNLERTGITDAVTINGLLDPIERAESIRRVASGEATMLYISPESLRSKTIENLLLNRQIARFVIDEAHCFSAWGQDFRVDYLYIGDFMMNLYQKKGLSEMIPVSCFTATAKQNVVDDILKYFNDKLQLNLQLFTASGSRKNLQYKVFETNDDNKYERLRDLLENKKCPTIIYVSRTKKASELAQRLTTDGYPAEDYHGKMVKQEKSENQDAFIRGDVRIMVATSAFGMGVDKKDVGMVIHYDISNSLENYVQEAGRAGRDENISADCYVLFNDEDLNKHFLLLNQTKISQQEIQQVWKAIKGATRFRTRMSNSALEIAREAGWDENVREIETRVKTAIAALEDAGYVKRGQNMPRIFADSIQAHNAMEAIEKLKKSALFAEKDEMHATRIIKKLIAVRSRKQEEPGETAESRVDCIADDLGLEREYVIYLVQLLREAKVLSDAKDLTAFLDESGAISRVQSQLSQMNALEDFILSAMTETQNIVNVKELNELGQTVGLSKVSPERIRTVLNYWAIKNIAKREVNQNAPYMVKVSFQKAREQLLEQIRNRHALATFILQRLYEQNVKKEATISFSVLELQETYNQQLVLGLIPVTTNAVEGALFYLSKIGTLKLEGGFLVTYNRLSVERLEKDNRIQYKVEDYQNLKRYYEQKTQMIHIVGEYAKKVMSDYQAALAFVEDYFQLEYSSFLRKYFRGTRGEELQQNVTPKKFRQLFGELSLSQLAIINDKSSKIIVVAAGPGSGKTKLLAHKLASLLLMEDVKHEQLLMVTFSRAAATEFKKRLQGLIGNAAHFVEIKTFHSFCFDLLGRVGTLEKSTDIIREATERIDSGEAEVSHITRTVMVIDEAQDMDIYEFGLVQALMRKNEEMRVIAVGDDDQNIFAFRGSDAKHMQTLMAQPNAQFYELTDNYRSRPNLVAFTNNMAERLACRLKKTPVMAVQSEAGCIKIIQYQSRQLVTPLVEKMVAAGIQGSTCILTKTNDEALQITGLLQKNQIHAKLIQSSERYNLYNLLEIRFFLERLQFTEETKTISLDIWDEAKKALKERFMKSRHLPMCLQLIQDFEETNEKYKYKSDLLIFIRESVEEDFLNAGKGAISVSTMHKSKGREFEHVVIVLSNFYLLDEESKRLLYVAMTRAKQTLTIHYHGDYLNGLSEQNSDIENLRYEKDNTDYAASPLIAEQLSYSDVFLSYFEDVQPAIRKLTSGEALTVDSIGCMDSTGRRIVRFSKKFLENVQQRQSQGYSLRKAQVNHILYWQKIEKEGDVKGRVESRGEVIENNRAASKKNSQTERKEKEILVLFPEVVFELGGI